LRLPGFMPSGTGTLSCRPNAVADTLWWPMTTIVPLRRPSPRIVIVVPGGPAVVPSGLGRGGLRDERADGHGGGDERSSHLDLLCLRMTHEP